MKTLVRKFLLLLALVTALHGLVSAQTVSFTLKADTFAASINGLTSGDAGPMSEYTVGILFHVTDYMGKSVSINTIGFCAEIQQPVSVGVPYTFDMISLSSLSSSTAGSSGTASSSMPAGGIGALAAARLNYLYDNHYAGTGILDWDRTESAPDMIAFQLAQWEITHDSDLNLSTGNMWVNSSLNTSTLNTNVINLAQSWLTLLSGADVKEGYTAQNWDVVALSSPNNQDLVLAFDKGALPVPEPGSFMLVGLGMVFAFGRRTRKKA